MLYISHDARTEQRRRSIIIAYVSLPLVYVCVFCVSFVVARLIALYHPSIITSPSAAG